MGLDRSDLSLSSAPDKGEQLEAAQKQLVVFAQEMRELYRAERERSVQLALALEELRRSYLSTMSALAAAVEARDRYTAGHQDRCFRLGRALTKAVAPELAERSDIAFGFLLHDIGKIGVPETILGKRGPLADAEWDVMRQHPQIGERIVLSLKVDDEAVAVIRHHHERWDGEGYPDGLRGHEIPQLARIFSVADSFDAMTTDRPYRLAMPTERAADEIVRCSGTQFDPEVVEGFLLLLDRPEEFLEHDHDEVAVPA